MREPSVQVEYGPHNLHFVHLCEVPLVSDSKEIPLFLAQNDDLENTLIVKMPT